jgi:mannose-6-phosphate isomerase
MSVLLEPIRFQPVFKQILWGGRRLATSLHKPIGPESDYAESWEIVDHGNDQSVVADGPMAGLSLANLVRSHRQELMGQAFSGDSFPLLLKYLDCNRVLSVQVHPDDRYASEMAQPDLGKTEAWYIVESEPGALVYAGLKSGIDRASFREAMETGQTEQTLHSFHPQAGDVIFIPAGTVHALGSGLLVAEIQQSSDTTFRLFDWNRVDSGGKSRQLHLEQGLDVTDYESGPVSPVQSDMTASGWQTLVVCDKFELEVLRRGTSSVANSDAAEILTVPAGQARLRFGNQTRLLRAGDSLLLPAKMVEAEIEISDLEIATAVLRARLPGGHSA